MSNYYYNMVKSYLKNFKFKLLMENDSTENGLSLQNRLDCFTNKSNWSKNQ